MHSPKQDSCDKVFHGFDLGELAHFFFYSYKFIALVLKVFSAIFTNFGQPSVRLCIFYGDVHHVQGLMATRGRALQSKGYSLWGVRNHDTEQIHPSSGDLRGDPGTEQILQHHLHPRFFFSSRSLSLRTRPQSSSFVGSKVVYQVTKNKTGFKKKYNKN